MQNNYPQNPYGVIEEQPLLQSLENNVHNDEKIREETGEECLKSERGIDYKLQWKR